MRARRAALLGAITVASSLALVTPTLAVALVTTRAAEQSCTCRPASPRSASAAAECGARRSSTDPPMLDGSALPVHLTLHGSSSRASNRYWSAASRSPPTGTASWRSLPRDHADGPRIPVECPRRHRCSEAPTTSGSRPTCSTISPPVAVRNDTRYSPLAIPAVAAWSPSTPATIPTGSVPSHPYRDSAPGPRPPTTAAPPSRPQGPALRSSPSPFSPSTERPTR